MFWGEFLIVVVLATVFSLILVAGLGWRHPRSSSGLGAWLFAFLMIGLFMWAASAWIAPVGPAMWGVTWGPMVGVGLLVFLVILALAVPVADSDRVERGRPPENVEPRSDRAMWAFGTVFWILVLATLGTALIGEAML